MKDSIDRRDVEGLSNDEQDAVFDSACDERLDTKTTEVLEQMLALGLMRAGRISGTAAGRLIDLARQLETAKSGDRDDLAGVHEVLEAASCDCEELFDAWTNLRSTLGTVQVILGDDP